MSVKKQPSRKGKKAWIKNVDISAVENELNELRNEEILGGKIHEKDASDMFFVDTKGNERIRQAIKNKTLKIDEELLPQSAIPGILSKKTLKKTTVTVDNGFKKREISRNTKLLIDREAKKKAKAGILPGDGQKALKQRRENRTKEIKKAKGGYDLWDEPEKRPLTEEEKHVTANLKQPIKRKLNKPQGPEKIPAVPVIHPGGSYQPTEEDHDSLIKLATDEELAKIHKKEKINQTLSYPPELDALPDETFFDNEEDSEEDVQSELETLDTAPKKAPKTKTQADLNRKKRAQETLKEEQKIAEQKKLLKQLNKIKEIEKELADKKLKEEEKKKKRKELSELQKAVSTKRLSRYEFNPIPMEVQLSDEICDSLRTLKPEGNLIKDRFKSLEARNIIEMRIPVKRKHKYKKYKEVESHDYKRFK